MKQNGPTTNKPNDINGLLDKKGLEGRAKQFDITGFSAAYLNKEGVITTMPVGAEATKAAKDVSEDSVFCAASLSKPLFSYLVLRLAASNQINLDDSLDTFFKKEDLESGIPVSEWIKNVNLKKLTPRMLLQHRSGLPIGGPKGNSAFQFEPGTHYGYSGIGILCLQEAITAKTGRNLEDLAKEYVFEHCKMSNSTFIPTPESPMRDPQVAANSLHTTAKDYAQLVSTWMNDDNVENAFLFDEDFSMIKDPWAVGMQGIKNGELEIKGIGDDDLNKLGWGIGIGLQRTDEGITAFHSGDATNTRAFVAFNLKDKTAIVYLSNSDNGLALVDEIASNTVGLPHGSNYIFEKYGFERNFEPGWQDRQQARFDLINQMFPPNKPFKDSKLSDAIVPQFKEAQEKALSLLKRSEKKEPDPDNPSPNAKATLKPSLEVEIKVFDPTEKDPSKQWKKINVKK